MKKFSTYYVILILLIAAYATLILKVPLGSNGAIDHYGITDDQARLLSLTIIIPYALIWCTAFFGFVKVKQYATLVGKSKDGKALKTISDGLMLLAFSLPLNAIASTIRNYINSRHAALTPTATIMYNYFTLALTLAGIWLIANGAKRLAGTLEKKRYDLSQTVVASVFTAFCIFYTYLTLTDPARQTPGQLTGIAAYYMPDFLVFSTIVVPYICVWYLGLGAAYNIRLYRKNAKGILYRKALGYLAGGIAFVVLSLMVLRLTTSITSFLNDLSLQFLLAFIYMLLVVIGIGYALIAAGAKRLKKIEEV